MKGWLWLDIYKWGGGDDVYCLTCGYDADLHMYFDEEIDPTFLFQIEDDDDEHTVCTVCGKQLVEVER